jgi:hypothetical protein
MPLFLTTNRSDHDHVEPDTFRYIIKQYVGETLYMHMQFQLISIDK